MKSSLIKSGLVLIGCCLMMFGVTITFCGCEDDSGHGDGDSHDNSHQNEYHDSSTTPSGHQYVDNNQYNNTTDGGTYNPPAQQATMAFVRNNSSQNVGVTINGQSFALSPSGAHSIPFNGNLSVSVRTSTYSAPGTERTGGVNYDVTISNANAPGVVDAYVGPSR